MYDVLEELFLTFQEQDYANGFFDVIFHVDGKELYAHRAVLASASPVFKKQFLSSKSDEPVNQPIPIFDYSYDEFYEFLYFIYIPIQDPVQDGYVKPACLPENVYVLAELAHAYEIDSIKYRCAQHITWEMRIDVRDNRQIQINETFVLAHKYLSEHELELDEFLVHKIPDLRGYNDFVTLEKSVIEAFVWCKKFFAEQLCEKIYKWGEHQAMLDENMSEEEKNELVLDQISDIIPLLKFEEMDTKFLFDFAVEKGLISIEEANKHALVKVSVKYLDKKIMGSFVDVYGIHEFLEYDDGVIKFLQPFLKNVIDIGHKFLRFPYPSFKIPSTPSTLQKMKGVEWYLLFDENGKLYIKHRTLVKRNDYLIAEMKLLNTAKNVNGSSVDESFVISEKSYLSVSRGE